MAVAVRDARGASADRRWIESVYRQYLDDLSPANTGVFPILGEVGHTEPDQFKRWFDDRSAYPLLLLKDDMPAGFAIVARASGALLRAGIDYRMAEFFVARPFRRLGVGRAAVPLVLDRFAGRWQIMEYTRNSGAVNFWRRVVMLYTRGHFQERILQGEIHQTFVAGANRPGLQPRPGAK